MELGGGGRGLVAVAHRPGGGVVTLHIRESNRAAMRAHNQTLVAGPPDSSFLQKNDPTSA